MAGGVKIGKNKNIHKFLTNGWKMLYYSACSVVWAEKQAGARVGGVEVT